MTFREARPGSHLFNTTRWSLIQDLDSNDPAVVRSALEELARIYRPVVERCFARCGAWNHADVEDAAQEFFEVIVLERHLFAKAEPGRGRLRALLWTAIRHFHIDRLRRTTAPRTEVLPTEDDGLLVEAQDIFERDWAHATLAEAIRRCHAHLSRRQATDHWAIFEMLDLDPRVSGNDPPTHAEVAARLGLPPSEIPTIAAKLQYVHRRLLLLIREVIAETVAAPDEAEEEFRLLKGLMLR